MTSEHLLFCVTELLQPSKPPFTKSSLENPGFELSFVRHLLHSLLCTVVLTVSAVPPGASSWPAFVVLLLRIVVRGTLTRWEPIICSGAECDALFFRSFPVQYQLPCWGDLPHALSGDLVKQSARVCEKCKHVYV